MKFVIKEGLDDSSAEYYRGVTIGEAISAIPNGLQPSAKTEQMPIDPTIVEYAIGDEYFDMQEEEIEDWIKNTVPWYDGSVESVSNGVMLQVILIVLLIMLEKKVWFWESVHWAIMSILMIFTHI